MVKMVNYLLLGLESALFKVFGSYLYLALILVVLLFIFFVWRGLDLRYALMLLAPCIARLAEAGWLPVWVGFMMWFFVVGFGLYLGWRAIAPSF